MACVVVIGGAGRLGAYIIRELRSDYTLRIVDRHIPARATNAVEADILDLSAMRRAVAGADAVIHVAGIDGHVQVGAEVFFQTNVMGTWNVLQAATDAGIRKIVVCSSSSATGLN